ncbi:hypothetical protein ID866_10815 [Astraeus odoratus]|nr:hypothetical protein ID866_10815 [Astraeus odoratus]
MEIISLFKPKFNLDDPLDAASFACLTICFWCVVRVGKFTVPSINSFNSALHITRSGVTWVIDKNSLTIWRFTLPVTKTSRAAGKGEIVQCAHQEGPADPIVALENHFHINTVAPDGHLFAWIHANKKCHPLSKREFINRINKLAEHFKLPNLKGHSLCIVGTLEYFFQGVPFDIIQSQGRWASSTFTLYLCKHAMILTPYFQASPTLEPFTRYT